jgi:hypothetical protein
MWDPAQARHQQKECIGFKTEDISTIKVDWTGQDKVRGNILGSTPQAVAMQGSTCGSIPLASACESKACSHICMPCVEYQPVNS